jgi:DNA-directed RNA polymerase subunit RPC12/RpoP
MKNEPDEIHFDCPKCKRPMTGDKALLGEMINCPDCGEPFFPTPRKPAPTPEPKPAPKPESAAQNEISQELARRWEAQMRSQKIRNCAESFAAIAAIVCVVGVLTLVAAICNSIAGESAGTAYIIGASLIGAASWLYLVAQIVHIRANTEK